jgi:hypothetical protein
MLEWEETDSGLRVFDSTKTEVRVDADDWEPVDAGHTVERPLDESVAGYASEIRLPPGLVFAHGAEADTEYTHGSDADPLELPDDEYLLDVTLNIKTYVKFSGPATVWKSDDYDHLYVSFPERTLVTLGFRSHHEEPIGTVTVPRTPAGVATAVTHSAAAHKTTGPDRSFPNLRGHPPRIAFDDRTEIPDAIAGARPEVGIELAVPEEFAYVYVAAPLAHYLQAELTVTDRRRPVLRAPAAGVDREFGRLPTFQHEVADTLRRVFFLDCLVRNAGEFSWELAELDLLDELALDPAATYEATPAEQLRTYLDADYERIDDDLPAWHLAVHVADDPANAAALPYLLDSLSLVYRPESTELDKSELLSRSIDDFYRSTDTGGASAAPADGLHRATAGRVEPVDRRDPVLHDARISGWLADGVPIDVFNAIPDSYENRFKYLDGTSGDIDVTVVLNDEEMVDERETVSAIYQERGEDLPIDLTVHERLTRRELAELFESSHDFVHYIGHCEEGGLRCRGGNLSVADIDESNVQTFFLNACGSYYEGRELVRKGSAAGAVTFTKVLNKQAATVGAAFARLLINGFSIQRALQFARRRIMMGKDYAVVGDGTHTLTQTDNRYSSAGTIEERDGAFEVTYNQLASRTIGGGYQVYLPDRDEMRLHGNESTFTLDRGELRSFLDRAEAPFVYDGDLYWSDELAKMLTE